MQTLNGYESDGASWFHLAPPSVAPPLKYAQNSVLTSHQRFAKFAPNAEDRVTRRARLGLSS
jgi:hypothetical protein